MDNEEGSATLLVQLPKPCLVAVLQHLTDDPANLFSAARSHSRLHQAAAVALRSIKAVISDSWTLDQSLLPYLARHGQYIDNLHLRGHVFVQYLHHLPSKLQLTSLVLVNTEVQLYTTLDLHNPGVELGARYSWQGVLGAAEMPLKQLELRDCTLLDGTKGLEAALEHLPGLEHLSVDYPSTRGCAYHVYFPTNVLEQMQQLTHLDLKGNWLLSGRPRGATSLRPLQVLTRLVDLRLGSRDAESITTEMLSGLCLLTRLDLPGDSPGTTIAPGALAGKTRLQHLDIRRCNIADGAAGVAELLSQLQHLTQLTHLDLIESLAVVEDGNPPAAAYSALTASSKLHRLDITGCMLPVGVWQHIFPAGRQLPHLQNLLISKATDPSGEPADAPDGSRIISCCPGLQGLCMHSLVYIEEELAPLEALEQLGKLRLITTLWDSIMDRL
jgi:hypothetical protein